MVRFLLPATALVLVACSAEPTEQESADDFASRIGGNDQQQDGIVLSQSNPDTPNTANDAPPSGVDLTSLQKLGDIGGVDLGPREGGCTLMVDQNEMIIAAGMRDVEIPGKAVVRLGNGLTTMDSGPGGLASIKRGTTFSGEGFTVKVQPAAGDAQSRPANVLVTDAAGATRSYLGRWICA